MPAHTYTPTHTHTHKRAHAERERERKSEPQGKMKREATNRGVVGAEERNNNADSEPCPVGQRTENRRQLRSQSKSCGAIVERRCWVEGNGSGYEIYRN